MKKLKILTLCYEYPPVGGGGGRVAAQVSAALAHRGHEVRVITAGMSHLPPSEKIGGVLVRRVECLRRREDTCSILEMFLFIVCAFLPALRLIRRWRPDVMHVHFAVPTGALALPLRWITKTPYVLTAHLGDVPGGVPEQTAHLFRWLGIFIAPIWKNAAASTAVSTFVAGLAQKAYGVEPRVILNGVASFPQPELRAHDPVQLLFVGRLSVQKNPLALVALGKQLRDVRWKMDIIGEGPLSPALRSAVQGAGLHERVVLHGWKSAEEVRGMMLDADILLMPSHSEGLPMAAIEALHCGMAIVGNKIPGLQDVLLPGMNGEFCGPADLESQMAAAVRGLAGNPARLMEYRKESLRLAAHFDLAKSVAAYEEVLGQAATASTTHEQKPQR